MKKWIILIIGILCLGAAIADTLTYGPTNYVRNRQSMLSGSVTRDPLWLFMNEVDGTFGGTESIDFLLFSQATEPGTPAAGQFYFDTASNTMKFANNSASFVALASASGNSLDQSYDAGVAITVDNGAVALTATNAANNVAFAIAQSDTGTSKAMTITNAGSGNSIDIQGSSGFDIQGTSDSWSISVAGIFDGEALTGVTHSQLIEFNANNQISFTDNSKDLIMNFGAAGTAVEWISTGASIDEMSFGTVDDLTKIANITFDAGEASIITQAGSGDADDLTIRQTGTADVSLILSSAGSITDALSLITTDVVGVIKISSSDILDIDAVDNINIDTSAGAMVLTSIGGDITLDASDSSIVIRGTEESATAIVIDADGTVGGITLDYGTGNFVVTGTGVSADFTLDADLISIDGTGASNITFTNGADEDVTISTAGAADHSLIITTTGTAADSLQITTTAGGMDITNGGASGEDLDIDGVLSAVTINSDEATTDAIDISASAGGITMASTAVASAWTHVATGTDDNLTLSVTGATASSLVLSSSGTGADAIDINATAGGIDIDISGGVATEDFAVTTDTSITFIATEAVADQFSVDAQGTVIGDAISLDTTDGGIMLDADGGSNGDIELNAASDISLVAAGIITFTGAMYPAGIITETISANDTMDTAADVGTLILVDTAAVVILLPGVATGLEYWVMNIGADGTEIHVDTNASDKILGGCGFTALDDGDRITNTGATANKGDYVRLRYGTAVGWYIVEMNGIWADGG